MAVSKRAYSTSGSILRSLMLILASGVAFGARVQAVDRLAGSRGELQAALSAAQPGDNILLLPGVIEGGVSHTGLSGVTIRSQDPISPTIIRGGVNGIQLSSATDVTIERVIFEQQTGNGLNIDDGLDIGPPPTRTPSTGITLRSLIVRDMNAGGNNDGIKLSGVDGFLIDRVVVENWGAGGSAIDPVGSHNGLIQDSIFRHDTSGSSGVRPKGGSKNIRIYANRFEMPGGTGRAIQAGGSTGTDFFRFIDGDSGYEAAEIVAAGNLIVSAHAPFSYANIDGGVFHHNWVDDTRNWAVRILNENQGNSIVDTQNGVFMDNVIEYDGNAWNRSVNVGGETLPETFTFARNQWNNATGPTDPDALQLPVEEAGGVYGEITVPRVGDQIRWDFPWGHWVVNASEQDATQPISVVDFENLLLAVPGETAEFDPLAADPLSGAWSFAPLPGENVEVAAQSQMILVRPDTSAAIPNVSGDYDRSGTVDALDYALWKQQFVLGGPALADGNGDGTVNLSDYTLWRDNLGNANSALATLAAPVPVPPLVAPACVLAAWVHYVSSLRRQRGLKAHLL